MAAKLGKAHLAFWLASMALFYLPLAAVVIYLNKLMPLEGGLYQWAKVSFGEFWGFLTAWNLWVYALFCVPTILFVIPTDLSFMIGSRADWLPGNKPATLMLVGLFTVFIAVIAVRGLGAGKWLHNYGSTTILVAYAILLPLPLWAFFKGRSLSYTPFPWQMPQISWLSLAIFGQMTIGGLSGFEYVAIMAGECRSAARTIGQSVMVSAPIIALMFILGTSSVLAFIGDQPINLIGPIPQTFRLAFGAVGLGAVIAPLAIFLLLSRAVASASLIFTGLTRLPMTAGWDHLLPGWFTSLHPRWKTPVNSILFVTAAVVLLLILSMSGVKEQETQQLLLNASSVHYGVAYIALFAIPFVGAKSLRSQLPVWLKIAAVAGFGASIVSVCITLYPIIDIPSHLAYAAKIGSTVLFSNAVGILIYRRGTAR